MKYSQMLISCMIFKRNGLDDYFESDHDVIFGPNLDAEFNDVDKKDLETLGWFKSDEYDCWCTHC